MDIRFQGKNLAVTEGMKDHLRDKLSRFEKYAPRLVEAHVVLNKEKYFFEAEVTLLAKNLRAYGESRSKENIYGAIDLACARVEKQLKKYREKVKDHHKGAEVDKPAGRIRRTKPARVREEGELPPDRPRIVTAKSFAPKPMSAGEASLQLELIKDSFLVFQNAVTQKVNVIFKREDGNHGLIEPGY